MVTSTHTNSGSEASPGTASDLVYERVRAQIMERTLAPGDRIGIDGVAADLGVSHTPVREAMNRLSAEGLADYRPRAGYRVTAPLDADAFQQMMEARLVIEPKLAGLAAVRRPDSLIVDLKALAALRVGSDVDRERNPQDPVRDAEFHSLIAVAARNDFLERALAGLRAHLHLYRFHHPATEATTQPEHEAIVEALASGRSAAAEAAMVAHLDASYLRHAAGFVSP